MTVQPLSSAYVAIYPFHLSPSILDEVDGLIRHYEAKPLDKGTIAVSARGCIERLSRLTYENLNQNLLLARECFLRLLKLPIEETQLEALYHLQTVLHLLHLEHDIQHESIDFFISLEKHLSQMIGFHLRPCSSSQLVFTLLSIYHSTLERLSIFPHLTENQRETGEALTPENTSAYQVSAYLAWVEKESMHDKDLISLLKNTQAMLQKVEVSPASNSLNIKQRLFKYLRALYEFLIDASRFSKSQEKSSKLLGESQDKAAEVGPSLGKTSPHIPSLRIPPLTEDPRLIYPTTPRKRTTIFISYSWSQSKEVDILEEALLSLDIEIVRDKRKLQYTDNLEAFMQAGAQTTEHTAIVISPAYLKSRNCLYELFHLLSDAKIARRLLIITYKLEMHQPDWSEEYKNHWKKEADVLEKKLSSLQGSEKEATHTELKLYHLFQNLLSDKLPPLLKEAFSFEELETKRYSPFKKEISKRFLPHPTHHFTGRCLLLETLGRRLSLADSSSPTQWLALTGEAGIGKTQVACKLIEQHEDNYTLILFFDATNEKSLAESYQRAALFLGLEKGSAFGLQELSSCLAEENKPWLLVYDNLHPLDGASLESSLPKMRGTILVTSHYAKDLPACFDSFVVEALTPAEAISILERLLPEDEVQEKDDLKDLAHTACYHPYALMQAIHFISKQLAFNARDYIELLEEKKVEYARRGISFNPLQVTTKLLSHKQERGLHLTGSSKHVYLESPRQGRTFWILHSSEERQEVKEVSQYLESQGVKSQPLIPDFLEDLEGFRRQLHKVEQILVLASPAYLKSEKCMPTLFYILQDPEMKKKVLPILTKGAKVHRAEYAKAYKEHWEKAYQALEEMRYEPSQAQERVVKLPPPDLFKPFLSQLLENEWKTMLTASFEEFQKDNYALLQPILRQGNLPQPTHYFLGRQSLLHEMKQSLVPPGIYTWGLPTKTVALRGVGGLGKTQLSRKFVSDYRSHYRLIFFFDSETELTLTQSYLNLAQHLGADKRPDLNKMELKDLKKVLHSHLKHHQPYLFVYDNVELSDSGWKEFEEELPQIGGSLLITTRRYPEGGKGKALNIEPFSLDDAVALLKQLIPETCSTELSLQALAERLDKIPLALSQAGRLIRQEGITVQTYLEMVQNQEGASQDSSPVKATCRTALAALEKVSADAKNLLALSSYLAADPIEISWLTPTFSEGLSSAASKLKLSQALQHLESYGMVVVDEKAQSFTLHRLIQTSIRDSLKEEMGKGVLEDLNAALQLLERLWKEYTSGTIHSRWKKGALLLPHVEAVAEHVKRERGETAAFATTLNQAGKYASHSGKLRKAIEFYEQSVEIWKRLYGEKHLQVMQGLGDLAGVYQLIGKYHLSIELYEKALQIAQELKDRAGMGKAYKGLGNAYYSLGKCQKAIEYHEKDLELAQELEDKVGVGKAYGNLGAAYYMLKEYQKAIEYHEKDLELASELKDRAGVGKACGNLGAAYYTLKEYQKAIDYHERRLAIAEELEDRVGVGKAYGNLGAVYHALKQHPKALQYHEKRLKIAQEMEDRAGEAIAYYNLAGVYNSLGQKIQATEFYKKSLPIFGELENKNYIETVRKKLESSLEKEGGLSI